MPELVLVLVLVLEPDPRMLAIAFHNTQLLPFLALAAIPIIIYLLFRQRYKKVDWAAMEFLERALRKNRRRLKLENLLLLAARVAAIALLAAALARPIADTTGLLGDLGEKRSHVLIAVDASYSMGYEVGAGGTGRSAFERAKKAALDIAGAVLKRGDDLDVLVVAEPPRFLYQDPIFVDDPTATTARVARDLAEVELTAAPADAAKAFAAIVQYLPKFDKGLSAGIVGGAGPSTSTSTSGGKPDVPPEAISPKHVYFVTDLQRSAFARPERGLRDPGLRRVAEDLAKLKADLLIVDVGAAEPRNAAIEDLAASEEIVSIDLPFKLVATVKNHSTAPLTDLTLSLAIDDVVDRTVSLALGAGELKQEEFWAVVHDPGLHKVHLSVKSDPLEVDNERYAIVDAREAIDVLLVDGEPQGEFGDRETDFLIAAYAPSDDTHLGRENLIRPEVEREIVPSDRDLSRYAVIVLANVTGPTDDEVARLEKYVREGGGLALFAGDGVSAADWNEKLWKGGAGLLPARLEGKEAVRSEEEFFRLVADTFHHPVLKPFERAEDRPLFHEPRFTAYYRVEETPESPAPGAPAGAGAGTGAGAGAGPGTTPGSSASTSTGTSRATVIARFERRRLLEDGREVGSGGAVDGPGVGGSGGDAAPGGAATGDPALIEKGFGRGRVVLFTSTADGAWNNFFAPYAYVMMNQRLVTYLAESASAGWRNLMVGEPFEAILTSAQYATAVYLTTPAQESIEKIIDPVEGERDRFRLVHAETERPGIYELTFHGTGSGVPGGSGAGAGRGAGTGSGTRTDAFAVNVDAALESSLEKLDEAGLKELLPELKFRYAPEETLERTLRGGEGPGAEEGGGSELWRMALFAVLGLLLVETALACHYGRKAA